MNSGKKIWSGFFSGGASILALAMLVVMILAIPAYISLIERSGEETPKITIDGVTYYYRDGIYYDQEGNAFDEDELLGKGAGTGELEEIEDQASSHDLDREMIYDKIDVILDLIDDKFILDYDAEVMEDYIYKGLIAGLGDPYSVYMTPEEAAEASSDLTGNYCGIGAMVQFDQETYDKTVTQVYDNSPASEAGIMPGDVIVSVDGEDVTAYTLDETVKLIRGEEGSGVEVGIRRGSELLAMNMIRRPVEANDVSYEMRDDGIGYIRLSGFNDAGIGQMKDALTKLDAQGMKSLIVDLRNNPGGSRTSVIGICDLFLDKGAIIAYEEEKDGTRIDYDSKNDPVCTVPMCVLVNENSASASELMCGALRDNGRATLIGTVTFGKGIIQTYYYLTDGSLAKLTSSYYYLPGGECIHGVGVAPNIVLEDDPETKADEQLERAVSILQGN